HQHCCNTDQSNVLVDLVHRGDLVFFQLAVDHALLHSFPTRRSSDLSRCVYYGKHQSFQATAGFRDYAPNAYSSSNGWKDWKDWRSEERFSRNAETELVCRLLLEKKNTTAALIPRRNTTLITANSYVS